MHIVYEGVDGRQIFIWLKQRKQQGINANRVCQADGEMWREGQRQHALEAKVALAKRKGDVNCWP